MTNKNLKDEWPAPRPELPPQEAVTREWTDPDGAPRILSKRQTELQRIWPRLVTALDRLAAEAPPARDHVAEGRLSRVAHYSGLPRETVSTLLEAGWTYRDRQDERPTWTSPHIVTEPRKIIVRHVHECDMPKDGFDPDWPTWLCPVCGKAYQWERFANNPSHVAWVRVPVKDEVKR